MFRLVSDDSVITLIWPRGFSARLVSGRAEIAAPDGMVITREGDVLANMLGGAGDAQGFHICSVSNRIYSPASYGVTTKRWRRRRLSYTPG